MQSKSQFDQLRQLIPSELLMQSGSAFYTGKEAWAGNADFYILGLNPGGDPEQVKQTVEEHTLAVAAKDAPWSDYVHSDWGAGKNQTKCGEGRHHTQRRVQSLAEKLGIDLRATPASNLIFKRTSTESALRGKSGLIGLCWPFHQAVIDQLEIKMVICFGHTVGQAVRKNLRATEKADEFRERNKREWRSSVYRSDSGVLVAVLTHPARADWTKPPTDPSAMLLSALAARG